MSIQDNTLIKLYENLLDDYGITNTWQAICYRYIDELIPYISMKREFMDDIPYDECGAFIECLAEENIIPYHGASSHGDRIYDDTYDYLFGELYEYGLAYIDKDSKRKLGQYYTPLDTALLMSEMLYEVNGRSDKTIIEPCCGCGNLIVPYLKYAYDDVSAWDIIMGRFEDGRAKLRLYDLDEISILITKTRLIAAFAPAGIEIAFDDIASTAGDFLLISANEPIEDSIVIMNPPYGRTDNHEYSKYSTFRAKDLYPLFLEKIACAYACVAITPQSFLGASKLACLRRVLSSKSHGYVISYDNVPSPMFNGRKHGIFNTNQSNSVRAAITLMQAGNGTYRVSPMLRWNANDRQYIIEHCREMLVGAKESAGDSTWLKVPPALSDFYDRVQAPKKVLADLYGSIDSPYSLYVPSTPRYFVSAAHMELKRGSQHRLSFNSEDDRLLAYLVLNSSLSYGWWRINDGGITLTSAVLDTIPIPDSITDDQKEHVRAQMALESERIIVKMNAGKPNENIKIGIEQLDANNRILFPNENEGIYTALIAQHSSDIHVEFEGYAAL